MMFGVVLGVMAGVAFWEAQELVFNAASGAHFRAVRLLSTRMGGWGESVKSPPLFFDLPVTPPLTTPCVVRPLGASPFSVDTPHWGPWVGGFDPLVCALGCTF